MLLIQIKSIYLLRFGDRALSSDSSIKGNPVRIRNSTRYCEAQKQRKAFYDATVLLSRMGRLLFEPVRKPAKLD